MSKRTPGLPQRPHNSWRRGKGKGITFLNGLLTAPEQEGCVEWPFYRMKKGYGQIGLHDGMASSGYSHKSISNATGVPRGTVCHIASGRTWKHVAATDVG